MTGAPLGATTADVVVRRRDEARLHGLVEAGRDDGDANLTLHRRLVHGAEDDLGVVADGVVDDLVDLVHFAEREVGAARDVHEHARSRRRC